MIALSISTAQAQSHPAPNQPNPKTPASQMPGAKGSGSKEGAAAGPVDNKSASPCKTNSASAQPCGPNPVAPAPPPPPIFNRPRIGLALGGGGALGLSEIGVLQWFEEHRIPVDVIAGTSMGCLVASLYSTGRTPAQMQNIVDDKIFTSVFSFHSAYISRSFRRRQDARDLPNHLTVGLRHSVSFRNSVLTDQGLNSFLDREFIAYGDHTSFNALPIPLRCVATDLTDASTVTFARGDIADAVRASVSLPAVFQPFLLNGHELVDGGVLDNLPTRAVHAMNADVVLAVSIPLSRSSKGDLDSLLGVLQRSFSVAIEGAERQQRKLASVVIEPDISNFTTTDYLRSADLARRGYQAAEAHKSELLPYALPAQEWKQYLAHKASGKPPAPGPVLAVRVSAPSRGVQTAVQRLFRPLIDEPAAPVKIEALLDQVRADGRYNVDYNVHYDTAGPPQSVKTASPSIPRPVVLVSVESKKTGPPFLLLGGDIQAQTGGVSRATVDGILLYQDLGSYGAELRSHIRLGYVTLLSAEYYRSRPSSLPGGTSFLAPNVGFERHPYPIYAGDLQVDHRELQTFFTGADLGLSNRSTSELRVGYSFTKLHWYTLIGSDQQPDYDGTAQRVHLRYNFDNQDCALVPHFGVSFNGEAAYLFSAVGSENAPQLKLRSTYAHLFSFSRHPFPSPDVDAPAGNQVLLAALEAGTMFGRNVATPYQYTLGGPLRLTASAIDQYRGTDYFLLDPAVLRRIATLPQPLGQSIYFGGGYELGQMRSALAPTVTRQDFFFGVFAETPLGVVTLTQSIGNHNEHKFTFTLGRLF